MNTRAMMMTLTGDYICVEWCKTYWYIHRETCKRGSIPIGDARFKYNAEPEDSSKDIIHGLVASGFPENMIVVLQDKELETVTANCR